MELLKGESPLFEIDELHQETCLGGFIKNI